MINPLRPDLPPLPARIVALPVDVRGYPVPYFVAWREGRPEFRAMDPLKLRSALQQGLCWVCGQPLGRHLVYVVGPMCVVNRISSEPACHLDCAEFSVRACPFLTKPHMVRRENDTEGFVPGPGAMILRNPGVTALYTTRGYHLVRDAGGGVLVQLGEPERVSWWKEGRPATRAECVECVESIESGLPTLVEAEIAAGSPQSPDELRGLIDSLYQKARRLLPPG
jgi:hypothetical protein